MSDRGSRIILFTGCVKSGKTTARLSLVQSAQAVGLAVAVFRPWFDDRDPTDLDVSQGGYTVAGVDTLMVRTSLEIYDQAHRRALDMVALDEVQFFDDDPYLTIVLERLCAEGRDVVVVGLDLDWHGEPFHATRTVMAMPMTKVIKKKAFCARCKSRATRSQKLDPHGNPVPLDADSALYETGSEQYRPLCRPCWYKTTPGAFARLVLPDFPLENPASP